MTSTNDVVVGIARDTREQAGFEPDEFPPGTLVQVRTMGTGDYTAVTADGLALTTRLLIERKSTGDLLNCLTHDRARFVRELERMREETAHGVLLVEDIDWPRFVAGHWRCRSSMTARSAVGSLIALAMRYRLNCALTGDRATAATLVHGLCRRALLDHAQKEHAHGTDETCGAAGEQVIPGKAPATTPTGLRQ